VSGGCGQPEIPTIITIIITDQQMSDITIVMEWLFGKSLHLHIGHFEIKKLA
jgi:hypothetical protein